MSAHRYWRVRVTATMGTYVSILELQMRTSIGGSNVATGGTASASSTGFGWVAANAFDGSTSEPGWHSNGGLPGTAEWLKYDFGSGNDKDIVEFAMAARTAPNNQNPVDFAFEYSDNDSTWTPLYTIVGEWRFISAGLVTYSADRRPDVPAENGRAWRLSVTANDGHFALGLSEVEMYEAGNPTNLCTGGEVFASEWNSSQPSFAFDGVREVTVNTSFWDAQDPAGYLAYRFAAAKTIVTLAITARAGPAVQTQAPKDFVLERWDGSAWQTVMTLTGITSWGDGQTRYFDSTGEIGGPPSPSTGRGSMFLIF
jgi:hypothetical protein